MLQRPAWLLEGRSQPAVRRPKHFGEMFKWPWSPGLWGNVQTTPWTWNDSHGLWIVGKTSNDSPGLWGNLPMTPHGLWGRLQKTPWIMGKCSEAPYIIGKISKDHHGFRGKIQKSLLKYLPKKPFQHVPVLGVARPCHMFLPFLDVPLNFGMIIGEHQETPARVQGLKRTFNIQKIYGLKFYPLAGS